MGRDDFLNKRGSRKRDRETSPHEVRDEEAASSYPCLFEFLACRVWNDKARALGSVTLFADEGRWKVCFADKEHQEVGFTTLGSLSGFLDALERALDEDRCDWRPQRSKR